MVRVIGGRDMHPESATVGGFLHIPSQSELDACAPASERAPAGRRGDHQALQQPRLSGAPQQV